jgi:hypothetical protein
MESPRQVFEIRYQQTITIDPEGTLREGREIEVAVDYGALTAGWLARFGSDRQGRTAFLILVALALHSRPLEGEDLEMLKELGLATEEDRGRLYSRITDLGLSEELGIHRTTIGRCIDWMREEKLVDVLALPEDYRDSGGQFAGNAAYLLKAGLLTQNRTHPTTEEREDLLEPAGELPETSVDPVESDDEIRDPIEEPTESPVEDDTVSDYATRPGTVLHNVTPSEPTMSQNMTRSEPTVLQNATRSKPESAPTVSHNATHRVTLCDTKLLDYKDLEAYLEEGAPEEIAERSPMAYKLLRTWHTSTGRVLNHREIQQLLDLVGPTYEGGLPWSALLSWIAFLGEQWPEMTTHWIIGVITGRIPLSDVIPAGAEVLPPHLSAPASLTIPAGGEAKPLPEERAPNSSAAQTDPLLAYVAQLYASEIGSITALVADELRDLTQEYPDPEAWDQAFRRSIGINESLGRWRYTKAVLTTDEEEYERRQKRSKSFKKTRPAQKKDGGSRNRRRRDADPAEESPHHGLHSISEQHLADLRAAAVARNASREREPEDG